MTKTIIAAICCLLFTAGVYALNSKEQQISALMKSHYGQRAMLRYQTWRKLIHDNRQRVEKIELTVINQFFNQLYFVDDIQLWGKTDYWATPLEFLGANAGDCEDFTIAKYFSLREMGISDRKLRLIYVKSLTLNQFHMVLAYYPTKRSEPLLLDNIDGEIKPASQRPDLIPIYSFNAEQLWVIKQHGHSTLAGKANRLKLWNDLRHRYSKRRLATPVVNYDE
ncbi:hypothetical protein VST7929_03284 [Vibrio stylophorae]|uniref:Sulfate adenylyltransferase n=1 Tax=Vibrio stylophorae TaxID=659351 RepID=A0ABN8DZD7_9VIBR|nr:transglutaminase-like cysteine peptidase [Vibrio stylophorae]CAH0535810.1 hypothetical protein VST7929_03284 [Vibrio stylophorae]